MLNAPTRAQKMLSRSILRTSIKSGVAKTSLKRMMTYSLIGQNKHSYNQEKQVVVVVVHGLDAS